MKLKTIFCAALTAAALSFQDAAFATISFELEIPDSDAITHTTGFMHAYDYIAGKTGGVTPQDLTSCDLGADTEISYTIKAPEGKRFYIDTPDYGSITRLECNLWFRANGNGDMNYNFTTDVTFNNVTEGTAPGIDSGSSYSTIYWRVSDSDPGRFSFNFTSYGISGPLAFDSITMKFNYASQSFKSAPYTYICTTGNFSAFWYADSEWQPIPEKFVSIVDAVPEPSMMALFVVGALGSFGMLMKKRARG